MAVDVRMTLRRVIYGSLTLLVAVVTVKVFDGASGLALWIVPLAGALLAAALAHRATWSTERWDGHLAFRREAHRRELRANAGVRWRPPFS